MNEWLASFSDPSFMPHGHCYLWRPDILYTHVLSDLAIGLAYYLIPIAMALILKKREASLPYPEIFGLFIAFIFFCGTTHFMNIYVTWYPAYEYQGWLKALTAFTSVLTAAVLLPRLNSLISLTGVEKRYQQSLQDIKTLEEKTQQMDSIYAAALNREERIRELKAEVNQLLKEANKPPQYDL